MTTNKGPLFRAVARIIEIGDVPAGYAQALKERDELLKFIQEADEFIADNKPSGEWE